MASGPLTLQELIDESHRIAREHGWWDAQDGDAIAPDGLAVRNIPEQLALFHSEISEALEEWRSGHGLNEIYYDEETGKPEGFPVELADLLIRVGDTAGRYGIDLEAAVLTKMSYNERRPYRHGGKKA